MYLFSSSTSVQWQIFDNFNFYSYGQLKLSDTSFFVLGYDPLPTSSLHLYRLTFSSLTPDWALTMVCQSATCFADISESQLISSTIYTFFAYGNPKSVYLAVISATDGSVSARYKSSIGCDKVYGSETSGDYILATIQWTSYYLTIFNKETKNFVIRSFSHILYSIELENTTGRQE